MIKGVKTDREYAISANEFIWDLEGSSELHNFVLIPILRMLKTHGAKTVLDIGCGNGALTAKISAHGYDVDGLDSSRTGIDLARKQFPQIGFEQLDTTSSDFPSEYEGKYDAVISVEVIEHLLLPRMLVRNALSALKPGGLLIVTTPYHGYLKNLALAVTNRFDEHWHPLRDYGHVKFFSKKTLLQLIGEFELENIRFETVGRVPVFARSMIVTAVKVGSRKITQ